MQAILVCAEGAEVDGPAVGDIADGVGQGHPVTYRLVGFQVYQELAPCRSMLITLTQLLLSNARLARSARARVLFGLRLLMGSLQCLQEVGEDGSVLIDCALLGLGLSSDTPHPGSDTVELGRPSQLSRPDVVHEVRDHAVSSPSMRGRLFAVQRGATFLSALR